MTRARRAFGGTLAIDAWLNKSIGIEAGAAHATEIIQEAGRIYTPPLQEAAPDGMAFSLTEDPKQDNLSNERDNGTSAGANRALSPRPSSWISLREGANPRRSAEIGRGIFEEILPGFPQPGMGGVSPYEVFGAEIAAVQAGRKPVFHDALGEKFSAETALKLARAFPELHVEGFGPHLIVVDPVQIQKMGATIEEVKAAAESDAIGEFLGYGAATRDAGPVLVIIKGAQGQVVAGFHTGLEHWQEFTDERLKDYADVIPGVQADPRLPQPSTS